MGTNLQARQLILKAKNFKPTLPKYTCQYFELPFLTLITIYHPVYQHISINIFTSDLQTFIYNPLPTFSSFIFFVTMSLN